MHVLFTLARTAHAILKDFGATNPANLKEFSAQFAAHVRPRDKFVTEIWCLGGFVGIACMRCRSRLLSNLLTFISVPPSGQIVQNLAVYDAIYVAGIQYGVVVVWIFCMVFLLAMFGCLTAIDVARLEPTDCSGTELP